MDLQKSGKLLLESNVSLNEIHIYYFKCRIIFLFFVLPLSGFHQHLCLSFLLFVFSPPLYSFSTPQRYLSFMYWFSQMQRVMLWMRTLQCVSLSSSPPSGFCCLSKAPAFHLSVSFSSLTLHNSFSLPLNHLSYEAFTYGSSTLCCQVLYFLPHVTFWLITIYLSLFFPSKILLHIIGKRGCHVILLLLLDRQTIFCLLF